MEKIGLAFNSSHILERFYGAFTTDLRCTSINNRNPMVNMIWARARPKENLVISFRV
jgi:hypothetical protein